MKTSTTLMTIAVTVATVSTAAVLPSRPPSGIADNKDFIGIQVCKPDCSNIHVPRNDTCITFPPKESFEGKPRFRVWDFKYAPYLYFYSKENCEGIAYSAANVTDAQPGYADGDIRSAKTGAPPGPEILDVLRAHRKVKEPQSPEEIKAAMHHHPGPPNPKFDISKIIKDLFKGRLSVKDREQVNEILEGKDVEA